VLILPATMMRKTKRWPFPSPEVNHRPIAGWMMAQNPLFTITHRGGSIFSVMSASRPLSIVHTIELGHSPDDDKCVCDDFRKIGRPKPCYHAWAVRFRRGDYPNCEPPEDQRKVAELYLGAHRHPHEKPIKRGRLTDAQRKNNAYAEERYRALEMLSQLCDLVEKNKPTGQKGRPRSERRDVLFGLVLRAWARISYKTLPGEVMRCVDARQVDQMFHYNTYWKYAGDYEEDEAAERRDARNRSHDDGTTEITRSLREMLVLTQRPVRQVERAVAIDASGVSTARTECHRASKANHNKPLINPKTRWCRLHLAYGVSSGIVLGYVLTASEGDDTGETTQFPELLRQIFSVMKVTEFVLADGGLAHEDQFIQTRKYGAQLISPTKRKWNPDTKKRLGKDEATRIKRLLEDKFLRDIYNLRNKIETGFENFKRLFRSYITSWMQTNRTFTTRMDNEMLCRIIAHNLRKLVHQEHLRDVLVNFSDGTALPYDEALDPIVRLEREAASRAS
jgi:hypothetical protein